MRRRTIHAPAFDLDSALQMAMGIVALVAVLGIGLIAVDRIRKMMRGPDLDESRDPLAVFRKSLEKGEMDEAEYRRIAASLAAGDPEVSDAGDKKFRAPKSSPADEGPVS